MIFVLFFSRLDLVFDTIALCVILIWKRNHLLLLSMTMIAWKINISNMCLIETSIIQMSENITGKTIESLGLVAQPTGKKCSSDQITNILSHSSSCSSLDR